MLYTPVNHFNWEVNNFGNQYPTSSGTTLTAHASANTKGTDTAVLVGIAEDCYGIYILFYAGATDVTIRRQMVDLLIDPAAGVGNAGSSWSVAINNIYTNSPSVGGGNFGYSYYFPLFLKAGTAIGARTQDVVGAATVSLSMRIYGKPTHPELVKVGTKVETLGTDLGSTSGTSVTPGTSTLGSYSGSLGALTDDAWWWQIGVGSNDTTMNTQRYWFDIAHNATSKYICAQQIVYHVAAVSGFEGAGKMAFGTNLPIRCAPAGTDVYVRAAAGGTPDSSMTAVVYAVSG